MKDTCIFYIKKTPLALALSGLFMTTGHAEMFFPIEMLTTENQDLADLSQFRADGTQLPGAYQVDIYVNQNFINNQTVDFRTDNNPSATVDISGLIPCLTVKDLKAFAIKTELLPQAALLHQDECLALTEYIPQAVTRFDFQKMRLDISVPQAMVKGKARGYIDPELWDEGINAALMNYSFSGTNRFAGNNNGKNYFLSLNGGVNIGPWRLRDYRTWNYYDNKYTHNHKWQRINTWAERTIVPFKSNLIIGESTTTSGVFDGLGLRGVQLSTDDNMLPDSQRGFSPIVRGTAASNAEVSIRQNGYVIYRTSVSPGAFEIDDLNPMNSSGDLEVTVVESDGNTRVFTVPYSSVPVMQREGKIKYSLAAGRFRASSSQYRDPEFTQGTIMWGLPHNTTVYGGMQYASNYFAAQTGAGIDMGKMGAVSADMTHADSTLADGQKHHGQSLRFLYAHAFNPSGTTLRLTGYRYSTKGFHTLDETALKHMSGRLYDYDQYENGVDNGRAPVFDYYNLYNNKRARIEANISQKMGGAGTAYLTGIRQTYWNTSATHDSLQAGYSTTIGPVSYFLNYSYTQQKFQESISYKDHSLSLSLSVPLNRLLNPSSWNKPIYATFNTNHGSNGYSSQQGGLTGTMLEDNNMTWNVSQGYSRHYGNMGNASADYRGTYGDTRAGYSYNKDNQQVNYGVSGGIILHRDGLTLGQPLGETSILVATSGASDISIQNEPGVRTDWRGYTIKPYASAYRENRISVDTQALDDRTDVENTVARVVPTKGAIVRADFAVRQGLRIVMTLLRDGKPLPFGAMVAMGDSGGIVGDNGQVYLSGMPERGIVHARWGNGVDQQCKAEYSVANKDTSLPVIKVNGNCK